MPSPTPLPPEARNYGFLLLFLAALVGLVGLLLVAFLGMAWRRYNARLRDPPRKSPMPDIWQAGGERLVNDLDQSRLPPLPDLMEDEDQDPDIDSDDEDEDEDDEPPPWQKH
jgi:hypothetical protein